MKDGMGIEKATFQERNIFNLWKKNKLDTGINLAFGFRHEGVERARLEDAVNKIVERHDRLRSSFFEEGGLLFRRVEKKTSSKLIKIEDFTFADLRDFVRPFDLEKGPLLRMAIKNDEILLDICHIVTDGLSMAIFFSELDAFYSGRDVSYNPSSIPDFDSEKLSANADFWAAQFASPFCNRRLPPDKKGSGLYGGEGNSIIGKMGTALTKRVFNKCRELSISPFVYYFSVFLFFLKSQCASSDVVTSTNFSGRSSSTMRTMGLLATVAPFRAEISSLSTVWEFLMKINRRVKDCLLHQNFDSEDLLSRFGFSDMRDFSSTIFTFEHPKIADIRLGGKKCSYIPIPSRHSEADFTMCFFPFHDECLALIIFRSDLFSFQRSRSFFRKYKELARLFLDSGRLLGQID